MAILFSQNITIKSDILEGSVGKAEETIYGPITPTRPEKRLRKCASNESSTGSSKVAGTKRVRSIPYGLRARKGRFVEPPPSPASPPRREIAPLIFLVAVLTSTVHLSLGGMFSASN